MWLFMLSFLLTSCVIQDYGVHQEEDYTKTQDTLISKCKKDLEYYADISRQKYGTSYSILKIKKFDDLESARDFSDIWGSALDINSDLYMSYNEIEYPIVIIAIKFKGKGGELPITLTCNSKGNLMKSSKRKILI